MDMTVYFPDYFKQPLRGRDFASYFQRGEVLTARVEEVLPGGKARIQLLGTIYEIEVKAPVEKGETVKLLVRESGGRLVLEMQSDKAAPQAARAAPAPVIADLLANMGVENNPENRAAFAALVRAGAPATAANIEALIAAAARSAGLDFERALGAGAVLMRHNVALTPVFIEAMDAILTQGRALGGELTEVMNALAALDLPEGVSVNPSEVLLENLGPLLRVEDAGSLAEAASRGFASALTAALAAVRAAATEVVASRSDLALIDYVVFNSSRAAAPASGANYTVDEAIRMITRLMDRTPVDREAALYVAGAIPRSERGKFIDRLLAMERETLSRDSSLRVMGDIDRRLSALLERAALVKVMNFAESKSGGELSYAELVYPAVTDGSPVRIRFKRKRSGSHSDPDLPSTITVGAEMESVGIVRGDITEFEKNLKVVFGVRDENVRGLFEEDLGDLKRTLRELGYNAEAEAVVMEDARPIYDDEMDEDGDIRIIDVKA